MNRSDFVKLSKLRVKEAQALLDTGNYPGAYYLCGYAVECALKACIAKKTRRHDFPEKETVRKSYTHKLKELVEVAGIDVDLKLRIKSSSPFATNWNVVVNWDEEARYEVRSAREARALFEAVADASEGVIAWISRYW